MTSSVGSVGSVGHANAEIPAESMPYRARLYDAQGQSLFVWSGAANCKDEAIDLAKAEYHAWCRAADIGLGSKDARADHTISSASAFQRRSEFCGISSFILNNRLINMQSGTAGLDYSAALEIVKSAARAEPKCLAAMLRGANVAVESGGWIDHGYHTAASPGIKIDDDWSGFDNKYIRDALRLVYMSRIMAITSNRKNSYVFYGYEHYEIVSPSAVVRAFDALHGPPPAAALLNWLDQHGFDDFAQRIRTSLAQ